METQTANQIKVVNIAGKGRGVIAVEKIYAGEVIEKCPFLILSAQDSMYITTRSDQLKFYALELTKINQQVLPLGYGMLYNHSFSPNSEIEYQENDDFILFKALEDIEPEQEITFNYDFANDTIDFLELK